MACVSKTDSLRALQHRAASGGRASRAHKLALSACLGLALAPLGLLQSGCVGIFCPSASCEDGGAWFVLTGPEGGALADRPFEIEIETPEGSALVPCRGGDYGPEGDCVDEVIFFNGAAGLVATGEQVVQAGSQTPVLAMQVFQRAGGEDTTHVYGPEEVTVRIHLGPDDVLLEHSFAPTYARSGSERCGYCDRVDDSELIAVDLDAGS